MPVPKFNRALVSEIARITKLPEEAIWITSPTEDRIQVYLWTKKMSPQDFDRITRTKVRHSLADQLKSFNAEGWLTKADPREVQPHDLHPLKSVDARRKYCTTEGCAEELYTDAEFWIGKCEFCVPK